MSAIEEMCDTLRKRAHVDLDCLISCQEGVAEECRIAGRIEGIADAVRFMERSAARYRPSRADVIKYLRMEASRDTSDEWDEQVTVNMLRACADYLQRTE